MADYDTYMNFVDKMCKSGDISTFKSVPEYIYMLEHVSYKEGLAYLDTIIEKTDITINDIYTFCNLNDSVGSPTRFQYDFGLASPTSIRYILHAHLILAHIKSLEMTDNNIVEVGGGYGGLCLAVHYFAEKYGIKITSYTIIDLAPIGRLQDMYISKVNPNIRVTTIDSNTYGATIEDTHMFLISNYCFSEIANEHQKRYIHTLFPKVAHGFMAWNNIPVYDFGFSCRVEAEYPPSKYSDYNRYVYF